MDISGFSGEEFQELYNKVLVEKERRDSIQKEAKIRDHVKKHGFYIEYLPSYQSIDGLERHILSIPVILKANSRSKYNDEIDETSYAEDFDDLPKWLEWLDRYLPQIEKDNFERTSDWQYGDWDDPLYAKGITELTIWYQHYDALCGLGIELEEEQEVFFVKINDSYKYYLPVGKAPGNKNQDVYSEKVGVWLYDEDISQKDILIIAGQIFKYNNDMSIDHSRLLPL